VQTTFLDATFWSALGRALGWDTPCDLAITCGHGGEECRCGGGAYWMYQWHCFIQHLANGDSPEVFFAQLRSPHRAAPRPAPTPAVDMYRHFPPQRS
jgi:hypothetical protein